VDDNPDSEQFKTANKTQPKKALTINTEWSTLPQFDIAISDLSDSILQTKLQDGRNGNDQAHSDTQAISYDTMVQTAASGNGMTRKKKKQLDKSSDNL
jgi:hypothetical protein